MYLTAHGLSFNIRPTGRFFGGKPDPADLERDLDLVAESGFEGYELWVEKLLAAMPGIDPERLSAKIREAGIRVPAFCFVGDFPEMGVHTAEPETAARIFELLSAIGCDVGIYVVDPYEGEERAAAMAKAAEKLRGIADIARDRGIRLAVEFIYTLSYLKDVSDALELIDRTDRDNVGISLDTFHFHMGGSRLEDIARIPRGRIYGIHVNSCPDLPKEDMTDKDRLPPALGVLPYAEILDACRDRGYDAHLSVEILHDDYWALGPEGSIRRIYDETKDALARWCE